MQVEGSFITAMSWNRTSYIKYPEYKQTASVPRDELDAVVARLSAPKPADTKKANEANGKSLSKEQIIEMLERLANTEKNREKTPERQRIGAAKVMGIVNTYAWIDGRLLKSRITRADGNWY